MTSQTLIRQLVALRDPMYRFARTLLQRQDEAEDVVADVVERLLREPERLQACRDVRALAMTAVRNRCFDLLRRRQADMQRAGRIRETAEHAVAPESDRWEARELVRRAMAALPLRQREVLHLKEIEGFTTRELAGHFATEEAQIRVWLSRARIRMRREVEKLMHHETK